MSSFTRFSAFLKEHVVFISGLAGTSVAIFTAGAYISSLKKDIEYEREIHRAELSAAMAQASSDVDRRTIELAFHGDYAKYRQELLDKLAVTRDKEKEGSPKSDN